MTLNFMSDPMMALLGYPSAPDQSVLSTCIAVVAKTETDHARLAERAAALYMDVATRTVALVKAAHIRRQAFGTAHSRWESDRRRAGTILDSDVHNHPDVVAAREALAAAQTAHTEAVAAVGKYKTAKGVLTRTPRGVTREEWRAELEQAAALCKTRQDAHRAAERAFDKCRTSAREARASAALAAFDAANPEPKLEDFTT